MDQLKQTLNALGALGFLTCYRIAPFTIFLNREAKHFQYEKTQKIINETDVFDFQTSDQKAAFTVDEWGKLLQCKCTKKDKEKIAEDLASLRKYLESNMFRTLAYKSISYKYLHLNATEFFNGIITPVFLEAAHLYQIDWDSIFEELRKTDISVKKFFGIKKVCLAVTSSKEQVTISCKDARVVIPKIKVDLKDLTRDYKSRGLLIGFLKKYWILLQKDNPILEKLHTVFFLWDAFNIGQPFQLFFEYIIQEAKQAGILREDMPKSKISVPETIVEGKEAILFEIGARLCTQIYKDFNKKYWTKYKSPV